MSRRRNAFVLSTAFALALAAAGAVRAGDPAGAAHAAAADTTRHAQPQACASADAHHRYAARCAKVKAAPTSHQKAGLAAARAGTGASAVAAEKSERMPVPKTGM